MHAFFCRGRYVLHDGPPCPWRGSSSRYAAPTVSLFSPGETCWLPRRISTAAGACMGHYRLQEKLRSMYCRLILYVSKSTRRAFGIPYQVLFSPEQSDTYLLCRRAASNSHGSTGITSPPCRGGVGGRRKLGQLQAACSLVRTYANLSSLQNCVIKSDFINKQSALLESP